MNDNLDVQLARFSAQGYRFNPRVPMTNWHFQLPAGWFLHPEILTEEQRTFASENLERYLE